MSQNLPPPVIEAIAKIGQDIRNARLRRRISVDTMSQRANIGRTTLYKLEKGNPNVAMGTYATVLSILDKPALKRFADLIDPTVDHWKHEPLPKRIRLSHRILKD